MLGNFTYHNPTKLYFGEGALQNLAEELKNYQTVQLIYGGGSVKKNGIYDSVMKILKDSGKTVVEDGGVMPNPTTDKLNEGVEIARKHNSICIPNSYKRSAGFDIARHMGKMSSTTPLR